MGTSDQRCEWTYQVPHRSASVEYAGIFLCEIGFTCQMEKVSNSADPVSKRGVSSLLQDQFGFHLISKKWSSVIVALSFAAHRQEE